MAPVRHVLLVDDDPAVREPLQLAFEGSSWSVDIAESFEAAMALLGQRSFDIVLTDKNLPTHSGLDLVRAMRQAGMSAPVLMMTGFGSVDSAIDSLNLGIEAYLQKPFDDIFGIVTRATQIVEREDKARHSERIRAASAHFSKASEFLQTGAGPEELSVVVANPQREECEWLSERLRRHHVRVEWVSAASALLTQVARQPPDIAIIDMDLAAVDTQSLLDALGRGAPDICCIVTCTRPELNTVIQLIELRVHAVLEKPFKEGAFGERVLPLLESVRRRRAAAGTTAESLPDRL